MSSSKVGIGYTLYSIHLYDREAQLVDVSAKIVSSASVRTELVETVLWKDNGV